MKVKSSKSINMLKFFTSLVLLLFAASTVAGKGLEAGVKTKNCELVLSEYRFKLFGKEVYNVTIKEDKKISYIKVTDWSILQNGMPSVLNGGVGESNVLLELKGSSLGFFLQVQIYANSGANSTKSEDQIESIENIPEEFEADQDEEVENEYNEIDEDDEDEYNEIDEDDEDEYNEIDEDCEDEYNEIDEDDENEINEDADKSDENIEDNNADN